MCEDCSDLVCQVLSFSACTVANLGTLWTGHYWPHVPLPGTQREARMFKLF